MVVTDVHSWIGGHARHEPYLNVDYGHVLSFYQRLQEIFDSTTRKSNQDLFFVMNGDFMDGTGLSTIPPTHLTRLLEHMPWDAVNCGNHELYFNETVHYLMESGFIDHWKGHYLASNTLLASTKQSIGNRYTYLRGTRGHTKVLAFGFLYNFENNCEMTVVEKVETVVQQDWFLKVLHQAKNDHTVDAILVLAHMDCVDPLVNVILQAIRNVVGTDMPIQFITGHSHRRAFEQLDPLATSFEPGRFLDTVGFVSFPKRVTVSRLQRYDLSKNVSYLFQHTFLDANQKVLEEAVGIFVDRDDLNVANDEQRGEELLYTPAGQALSHMIKLTQQSLGLFETLGCSNRTYLLSAGLDDPSSLWRLYLHQVVPMQLFHQNISKLFIQGTMAFRYNLFGGQVSLDDVIAVCPFNDTIFQVTGSIRGADIIAALATVPQNDNNRDLPPFGITPEKIEPERSYALYVPDFDLRRIQMRMENVTGETYHPQPVCDHQHCAFTTDLWKEYVETQWECQETEEQDYMEWSRPPLGQASFYQLPSPKQKSGLWQALLESAILATVCVLLVMRQIQLQSRTKETSPALRSTTLSSPNLSVSASYRDSSSICSPSSSASSSASLYFLSEDSSLLVRPPEEHLKSYDAL